MAAPRWEYKIWQAPSHADRVLMNPMAVQQFSAQEALNRLGAEGWELIGMAEMTFYFKRPLKK